jgi:hypothetical protein
MPLVVDIPEVNPPKWTVGISAVVHFGNYYTAARC